MPDTPPGYRNKKIDEYVETWPEWITYNKVQRASI